MRVRQKISALLKAAGPAVAGVDEAGRGPLAGPVIAAAVILDPVRRINGLDDSKLLTREQREKLALRIRERAIAWAVGRAEVEEIDTLNILHASMLAMTRAIHGLAVPPSTVMVDGNRCPATQFSVMAIVAGDASVPAIGAASILAKVTRDAEMRVWHEQYPQYGFHQHKGYSTPEHLSALREYGACPLHRRSFAPVQACLQGTLALEVA